MGRTYGKQSSKFLYGGCKRPVEMGDGIFVVVALTPYGGWFKEAKDG